MAVSAQALTQLTNGQIQGDVDLAPGVAIAPGVVLKAAPGCRLVVSAGVCLGADVVVQASHGDLILEPGVNLGSGVLVVGHGAIGQHTCVGANSTVINPALGPAQVVAPGSLVGAAAAADPAASPQGQPPPPETTAPLPVGNAPFTQTGSAPARGAENGSGSYVYGKTQVNRLLATLFPHRHALNGATPGDKP